MEKKLSIDGYKILKEPCLWGPVSSIFSESLAEPSLISNVHAVPFIGNNCVLLHTIESGWAMPGGTLEANESADAALKRELAEELGAKVNDYKFFGSWNCTSSLEKPYREHLPHPLFSIALGWANIEIVDSPANQGNANQETVTEIIILPVKSAIERLIAEGKPHLAAIYSLADEHRRAL
ncbi:MAG: NUDIX hydrolase [bacterium]|nr:NUDIX hydrolase [bacterium]